MRRRVREFMKNNDPCRECPFRKKSPSGYIGAHEAVEEITGIVLTDNRFPCHMEVTKQVNRGEKFERAIWTAPVCAGSAAMLCNMIKISRQPEVARLQKEVGKRPDVFSTATDMEIHHNEFLERRRAKG